MASWQLMYTLMKNEKNRQGKKYLPICETCINDRAQLVWSRGKKTKKLKDEDAKTKRKEAKRLNMRGKRTTNAG